MNHSTVLETSVGPTGVARSLTMRQADLLDRLVALVLAEGFTRFTLDEVAARLGCSKRSLYALASSKEQLATTAVRHFFRRATTEVEQAIAATRAPRRRVTRYLEAVAEALRPTTRAFRDDVASFAPAREIYETNTAAAAQRVRELIDDGTRAGAFRHVPTDFVAEVITATMRRIASGQVQASTGLTDAEAYTELARLVVAAVRR